MSVVVFAKWQFVIYKRSGTCTLHQFVALVVLPFLDFSERLVSVVQYNTCQHCFHKEAIFLITVVFIFLWVYLCELTKWPAPSCLDSAVSRALHKYFRGRAFECCSILNFSWMFSFCNLTAMIFHELNIPPAVQIYDISFAPNY